MKRSQKYGFTAAGFLLAASVLIEWNLFAPSAACGLIAMGFTVATLSNAESGN